MDRHITDMKPKWQETQGKIFSVTGDQETADQDSDDVCYTHFTGKFLNWDNIKCWRECRSTQPLIHYCWESKLVQAPLETRLAVSPKVKYSDLPWPSKSTGSYMLHRDSWTCTKRDMYKNILRSNAYN